MKMMGLLGSSNQPDPMRTLLGEYYNPRAAKWNAIAGGLEGLGIGLATGDWGKAIETSTGSHDRYMREAMQNYQLGQAKQDQDWQAQERARKKTEWAQEDATAAQMNSLLGSIDDPMQRLWAQTDPKGYFSEKYGQRESKAPASVQEYQYAVQNGYKGSYTDFKSMGRGGGVSLGVDPETGALTLVAGGAGAGGGSGAALPAELGARIGMGEQFLQTDVPEIAPGIKAGDATGPIDYAQGVLGRGEAGNIHRRMASGVDALRRNLTGAGMSASEADDYARRYLPTWSDDADTLSSKLQSLESDLNAVKKGALAGKTGNLGAFLPGSGFFSGAAQEPSSNAGNVPGIPQEAIADLQADPSPQAMQEFDSIFGAGASRRILGGK